MAAKRAIVGFKGIVLAPITTDTLIAYVSGTAAALQYAGQMTLTPKETKQDLYYDDDLYGQLRDVTGQDVEIRIAEVLLSKLADLGLGNYDLTTETFEGDFTISNKFFALRAVLNTISALPRYIMYRVFELTGVRFDNFQTKGDSVKVCEVILTGVFKKPQLASLKPMAIMDLKDDSSNADECTAFLTNVEPYVITYAAGDGTGSQTAGAAFASKKFTLPVCTFTYSGYHFTKWSIGGVEYSAGDTVVFTGDTTVTAVWVAG